MSDSPLERGTASIWSGKSKSRLGGCTPRGEISIFLAKKRFLASLLMTLCHFDEVPRRRNEEKSLLGQTKRFLASLRNDGYCHFFLREGLGLQVDFEMTKHAFYAILKKPN